MEAEPILAHHVGQVDIMSYLQRSLVANVNSLRMNGRNVQQCLPENATRDRVLQRDSGDAENGVKDGGDGGREEQSEREDV